MMLNVLVITFSVNLERFFRIKPEPVPQQGTPQYLIEKTKLAKILYILDGCEVTPTHKWHAKRHTTVPFSQGP